MTPAPTLPLLNGVQMPQLGLGTWPMNDAEASTAVRQALLLGYRLIDTAENYGNEAGVGEGFRQSGIPRQEIFLTTKFNRQWHSETGPRHAAEASLKRLQMEYIDLLLIHWPNPDQDRYVDAFAAMVKLLKAGLVRAIGVSNFKPAHLDKLFAAGLVPHVNQIQLSPYLRRDGVVAVHRAKGIVTESWSPLGRGGDILLDPIIQNIAVAHGKKPSQIILRWHVQSGYVPTPKSANPDLQKENLDVFGFSLTADEIQALNGLNKPDMTMRDSDVFGH
ncbi:aldo/keto reductase [Acidocella aminolytica]|uniref:Aldo/keto reductase, oxidoreductase n=1 Tax=Acidocella aminolytica 101 = DSM 11237 TaxID=1120923 RepID=A0A0D6PKS8_9PROT|nr:aldo/keto reductase [Acidocella aminolytica]GAN82021.1 aldo/keto reductase, oxidoreductase [Acidocella aminolytica 101 = DSM 11237]GBQ32111.1 aldo/keto reductase [Acidocella aminolytica 101 = DSM 11237]SHE97225.1 2,5-diketo-D-gluconate reductase A [Acidocella aminolytica 101 = DSM 11237]